MRTLQTLIALLASLLIAAAANAQNQRETMNDNKQTQTLCLGRFLVDVPKDAEMVGHQFLIKGGVSHDKVPMALELANRSLGELQYRRDNEIPTIPGFCIDGGFFAGEPALPHYESRVFNLYLKSHPDVNIYIYTRTNGEKVGEGLLARVDRKKTPDFLKELAKQIKTLRRGNHPVEPYPAEELLETYPRENGYPTHKFVWESSGKSRDIYAPTIVVRMNTGESSEYDSVRPSLTDKQAIELFDSIVNSIRLRPTGAPR